MDNRRRADDCHQHARIGGRRAPCVSQSRAARRTSSDHAGFVLKETLREFLEAQSFDVNDVGAYDEMPSDYPDYAEFGAVKQAQARGGFSVLAERKRRALRVHLGADAAQGLMKLRGIIKGK